MEQEHGCVGMHEGSREGGVGASLVCKAVLIDGDGTWAMSQIRWNLVGRG